MMNGTVMHQKTHVDRNILLKILISFLLAGILGVALTGVTSVYPAEDAHAALTTSRSKMSVSHTELDLTPKAEKISNGYVYTQTSKTVTVRMPFNATIYFKSSNPDVATGKWSMKWSGAKTKLTITGHARGSATITIYNNKNSQKLKIKVTVGGYPIAFRYNMYEEKSYIKKNGKNGYYMLNNITLINKYKNKAILDKKCALKIWMVDENGNYTVKNQITPIRGLPITIAPNKSKKVYIGGKMYVNSDGKRIDGGNNKMSYYKRAALVIKVGPRYKTLYIDEYGMVTKVRDGRDF